MSEHIYDTLDGISEGEGYENAPTTVTVKKNDKVQTFYKSPTGWKLEKKPINTETKKKSNYTTKEILVWFLGGGLSILVLIVLLFHMLGFHLGTISVGLNKFGDFLAPYVKGIETESETWDKVIRPTKTPEVAGESVTWYTTQSLTSRPYTGPTPVPTIKPQMTLQPIDVSSFNLTSMVTTPKKASLVVKQTPTPKRTPKLSKIIKKQYVRPVPRKTPTSRQTKRPEPTKKVVKPIQVTYQRPAPKNTPKPMLSCYEQKRHRKPLTPWCVKFFKNNTTTKVVKPTPKPIIFSESIFIQEQPPKVTELPPKKKVVIPRIDPEKIKREKERSQQLERQRTLKKRRHQEWLEKQEQIKAQRLTEWKDKQKALKKKRHREWQERNNKPKSVKRELTTSGKKPVKRETVSKKAKPPNLSCNQQKKKRMKLTPWCQKHSPYVKKNPSCQVQEAKNLTLSPWCKKFFAKKARVSKKITPRKGLNQLLERY